MAGINPVWIAGTYHGPRGRIVWEDDSIQYKSAQQRQSSGWPNAHVSSVAQSAVGSQFDQFRNSRRFRQTASATTLRHKARPPVC